MFRNAGETATSRKGVVCREIMDGDLDAVADQQARAFSARTREFWLRGLMRQSTRAIPEGYPRYGYMLETDGRVVGGVLAFYADNIAGARPAVLCNLAGWNVDPEFRGHAPRLLWAALKHKDVTYTDVTPAVSTYSIVEKLGFQRYCNGLFFSFPFLYRADAQTTIDIVSPDATAVAGLSDRETELLADHARYDCLSVVCHTPHGPEPFIFLPFRMRQGKLALPAMQLVYCRDIDSYKRCAGVLHGELLRRGKPVVILDANAAVDGLVGFYTEKRGRKYFRGPYAPSLTDLTNSELVLFGM